ncbi:MAG: hypothetical protein J7576_13290 [Siphonobacter aquaeclarae]|nr:hypothetical protein [Siphonobacter aquaeclarae]
MIRPIQLSLAVILLVCLLRMPYEYYRFVRLAATIGFLSLAYLVGRKGRSWEVIVYVALAVLFQPFEKILLGRTWWNIVDVVVALGLLISMAGERIPLDKE